MGNKNIFLKLLSDNIYFSLKEAAGMGGSGG